MAPRCGHPAATKGCGVCAIAARDPRYGAVFWPTAPPKAAPAPPAPCLHLGEATGRTVACPSCRGSVKLKTFACALHGECTPAKKAPGVACCVGCPDRVPRPAAPPPGSLPETHRFTTRDCLYHVYPLAAAAAVWRRTLGMLLRRSALFNGRKLISCMTGPRLEPADEVRRLAQPAGFGVVEIFNDPKLRETKTLLELLPRFQTADPRRALFFGHAKGVTRPDNAGVTCHPWAAMCHEISLDYWPLVESQLRQKPITGPFKKLGRGFTGSASAWHYSGSFAWFRSADLFARDWRRVDRQWWGSEAFVGLHYTPAEAGCLFGEGRVPELNLYDMNRLHKVLVEYQWWRMSHEQDRTPAEVPS